MSRADADHKVQIPAVLGTSRRYPREPLRTHGSSTMPLTRKLRKAGGSVANDPSRFRGRNESPCGRSRRDRANRLATARDPQGQGLVQSESLTTGMPDIRILVQD